MKITLKLNEIDYGALAEQILPLVQNKLAETDGTIAAILAKLAGMPPAIARKMVNLLPQETKDDIAVMLINKNKERILANTLKYAEKKGLCFHINDFEVE